MNRLIQSLAVAGALLVPSISTAAIDTAYNEGFETCTFNDEDAVGNITGSATCTAGLVNFVNIIGTGGNYGPNPMPNNAFDSGLQFGGIALLECGPAQCANVLNTFSNYADPEHANGNIVEVNIFKEMSIGAADLGNPPVHLRLQARRPGSS